MLRRLDENNNGMIDPDESGGRARFFLDRFARDVPGIDLSRPISIDRLSQAMQRARESGGSSSGSSSRSSSRSSSSSAATVEPLVPGFSTEESLPLPLPFGVKETETISVAVTPEDQREAEERLRRYDQNRDGTLDREEIGRNRWSDDPFVYDQNRDGKLTAKELAMRYARRRDGENSSRGSSTSNSGSTGFPRGGPSSSERSGGSSGGDSRSEMMVRIMFDRYDENKSGIIEKDEWRGFRSDPTAADTNKDSRISREELAAWLPSMMRGGFGGGPGGPGGFGGPPGGFGGPPGDGDRFSRRDGDRREGDRRESDRRDGDRRDSSSEGGSSYFTRRPSDSKSQSSSSESSFSSYRALTPTERLPKGLPEWFARNDANADGQVAMAEYSASWSDSVSREFKQFDLNHDGFITPKECLKASEQGTVRGTSSSSSVASTSRSNSSSRATRTSAPVTNSADSQLASASPTGSAPASPAAAPAATTTAAPAQIDGRTIAYFQGVIKKYDTNGDGVLVQSEWSSMSKTPDKADTDADGKITPHELAAWSASR